MHEPNLVNRMHSLQYFSNENKLRLKCADGCVCFAYVTSRMLTSIVLVKMSDALVTECTKTTSRGVNKPSFIFTQAKGLDVGWLCVRILHSNVVMNQGVNIRQYFLKRRIMLA